MPCIDSFLLWKPWAGFCSSVQDFLSDQVSTNTPSMQWGLFSLVQVNSGNCEFSRLEDPEPGFSAANGVNHMYVCLGKLGHVGIVPCRHSRSACMLLGGSSWSRQVSRIAGTQQYNSMPWPASCCCEGSQAQAKRDRSLKDLESIGRSIQQHPASCIQIPAMATEPASSQKLQRKTGICFQICRWEQPVPGTVP